jgi:hypothetical protein
VNINDIQGWVDASILPITESLSKQQDFDGNIVEIGIHHGKLFVFLASLLKNNEFAYAIDLFEDQQQNISGSGGGSLIRFVENLGSHLKAESKICILKENSLNLDEFNFHNRISARLFSVDGGHSYKEAIKDLETAARLSHPLGVILVDDYQNSGWDEVFLATNEFINRGDFLPLAMGGNKLFICRKEAINNYKLESISQDSYFILNKVSSIEKSRLIINKFPDITLF